MHAYTSFAPSAHLEDVEEDEDDEEGDEDDRDDEDDKDDEDDEDDDTEEEDEREVREQTPPVWTFRVRITSSKAHSTPSATVPSGSPSRACQVRGSMTPS